MWRQHTYCSAVLVAFPLLSFLPLPYNLLCIPPSLLSPSSSHIHTCIEGLYQYLYYTSRSHTTPHESPSHTYDTVALFLLFHGYTALTYHSFSCPTSINGHDLCFLSSLHVLPQQNILFSSPYMLAVIPWDKVTGGETKSKGMCMWYILVCTCVKNFSNWCC